MSLCVVVCSCAFACLCFDDTMIQIRDQKDHENIKTCSHVNIMTSISELCQGESAGCKDILIRRMFKEQKQIF